jgi:hypothetical protein
MVPRPDPGRNKKTESILRGWQAFSPECFADLAIVVEDGYYKIIS